VIVNFISSYSCSPCRGNTNIDDLKVKVSMCFVFSVCV